MTTPTEVRPFSNGSEAESWRWWNCRRCTKRGTPDAEGIGPCAIETAVAQGFILGTIPSEIATRAGATISDEIDRIQGTGYCQMPADCAEFDLVMTACEFVWATTSGDARRCDAAATAVITETGHRHAVCELHRREIARMAHASAGDARCG
jgi:hypothetical protein